MLMEQGISIEEAMSMDCLRSSRLITGGVGQKRVITRVNIMADYDIVNWVKEGELLLATEVSLNSDINRLKDLFSVLHSKNLAALAVKPINPLKGIPRYFLDVAQQYEFPLIELGQDIPFAEIMNTMLVDITNKQASLLMKMEKIHNTLMNILLTGGGISQICETLSHTLSNPILIRDNVFGKVFFKQSNDSKGISSIDYVSAATNKGIKDNDFKGSYYCQDRFNGQTINRVTIPILASNNIYGYIYLWDSNKRIENIDIRTLETACAIIALDIVKRLSVYQVESRYKIEFLENLLSKDVTLQKLAYERVSFFGMEESGGYVVLLLDIKNKTGNGLKSELQCKEFVKPFKSSIIQDIEDYGVSENKKLIIGEKSESIILLLWCGLCKDEAEANKTSLDFGLKIYRKLMEKYSIELRIGIGRYYKETRDLWRSYQDAVKAIALGILESKKEVIHFDNLGIYKLLSHEKLELELEKFYRETILPLVKYDNTKDTELIKTLMAYFEANGNLKKMSQILFTHYNTVLYRLQRIQEISKINLDNSHDRLNAEIGLKIYNILKSNETARV